MAVFLAGCALALLGVASAVLLMAAALGLRAPAPGYALWLFFPLFTMLGWALVAMASRDPAVRLPTRLVALPLLALALLAAVALVGSGAGLLQVGDPVALWFVLVLGGSMGLLGSIGGRRSTSSA